MKRKIKNILINWLPVSVKNEIGNAFLKTLPKEEIYFSQEGEDIILRRIFENQFQGFYVDIGAHHPTRFSNTFLFYQKGWKGINIDAMPGSMIEFERLRPRDINLEIPISSGKKKLRYHIFNEPALNTFSDQEAKKKDGLRNYKIINTVELETYPLSEILDKNIEPNQAIDFMSIDVEGLDFEVLQSNDWKKYRPEMILIECLNNSLEDIFRNEIYLYLKERGYVFFAKTFNTFFFRKEE